MESNCGFTFDLSEFSGKRPLSGFSKPLQRPVESAAHSGQRKLRSYATWGQTSLDAVGAISAGH